MNDEASIKERIFSEAANKFRTEGFAKTSIDDFVASLAMSKKTFYRVFSSKEDLVEQLANRNMGSVATHIEQIAAGNQNFVAKLHSLLQFIGTIPIKIGVPFLRDMQKVYPQIWKKIEQFRAERVVTIFGKLVDQGKEEGYIRPEVNKRVFLLCYLASVQAIMQPDVLSNESFSAKEAIQGIMDLYFRGAMTDAAHREFDRMQINNQFS
jgi:TetR/AcrR family transcriptional regulator, cholesterol catabolism regulator